MNDLLELGGSQLGNASFLVHQYPGLVGFIESINKTLKVLLFLFFFNSNNACDGWIV